MLYDKLIENEILLNFMIGSAISGDTMINRKEAEYALQFMIKFQLYLEVKHMQFTQLQQKPKFLVMALITAFWLCSYF